MCGIRTHRRRRSKKEISSGCGRTQQIGATAADFMKRNEKKTKNGVSRASSKEGQSQSQNRHDSTRPFLSACALSAYYNYRLLTLQESRSRAIRLMLCMNSELQDRPQKGGRPAHFVTERLAAASVGITAQQADFKKSFS